MSRLTAVRPSQQFIIGLLLLLALTVRLLYFNGLRAEFPDFLEAHPFCGLDANSYHHLYALGLLRGDWPYNEPFFHMILYPYFLGAVYALVGVNLRLIVVVQILLEVLACAAMYGIGRAVFNRTAGLIAAAIMAFYGPLIFFNACFAQVALSIPLFCLTLLFLLRAHSTGRWSYLIIAGILTGLAALSRPTFFLLLPVAGVWWLVERVSIRRILIRGAVYGGVAFLVTSPAAWHNYRTGGGFMPMPASGWEIIFLGNNPVAEGMGHVEHVLFTYLDPAAEAYINDVRTRAKEQSPDVFREEVLAYLQHDFNGWLHLMGRKIYLLLFTRDDNLISPYFFHNLQTIPFLLYFPFEWRSIFVASLLGVVLLKPKPRHALLLMLYVALPLFTVLFHIQFRFRLLLVPVTLLYAAAFISAVPRLSRWKFMASLTLLAGLTLVWPVFGWLLAVTFAMRCWAVYRTGPKSSLRYAALAAWSYLVVAVLVHHAYHFTFQTGQAQTIMVGPPIAGPIALGQSLSVPCSGFNELDLVIGVSGQGQSQPVTFHLRRSADSSDDIYAAALDLNDLQDRMKKPFVFPPQPDSAGQTYFVFVDAPTAGAPQPLTLRGTFDQPFDRYPAGSAYIGGPGHWQMLAGDLAFTARCQGNLLTMTHQAFANPADRFYGPPWLYWTILVGHLGLLGLALVLIWNIWSDKACFVQPDQSKL